MSRHGSYTKATLMALASVPLLAGCGGQMQDLKDFVAHAKDSKRSKITPPPEITPYKPYTYVAGDRRDPFTAPAGVQKSAPKMTNDNGLHPDFQRRRSPLEHFALDNLRMVGTISSSGTLYALVSSPDGRIHRVSTGAHMGRNYGQIVKVSQAKIKLIEIVPDGFGGYIKKPASIVLSSSAANGRHT